MRRSVRPLVLLVMLLIGGCGPDPPAGDARAGRPSTTGRVVEHAMGSTTVPQDPERVVVLDTQELDAAISLGVVPVGAVRTDVASGFPSYLSDKVASTADVGTIAEPDLENADERRGLRLSLYKPLLGLDKEERARIVDDVMNVVIRVTGS